MSGDGAKLLYRNATGFEKSLAHLDGDRITAIPAELIRDIWDPDRCPIDLLQYLAWAFGVEYWNDNWSETTKRQWVKIQWLFKSQRGTADALRMAVHYAGRDISRWGYSVDKITVRPQQVFSGPSLTVTEREAWLQKLPQVRVWRIRDQGAAGAFKAFYGGTGKLSRVARFDVYGDPFTNEDGFQEVDITRSDGGAIATSRTRLHSRRFCLGGTPSPIPEGGDLTVASTPSTAIERLKRRVRWVESGVETDTTVTEFGSYFRIHRSGAEDSKVFCDRCFGLSRYFLPSDASKRLLTVQPKTQLPWRNPITASLQAVTSEPERVKVSGDRDHSVFSGFPLYGMFFKPTDAPYRIYHRYAVLDQSIHELRRRPVQFMGTGRYGFPAFTAWADVSVGNELSRWAAGFGFYLLRSKFWIPHNDEPLKQVSAAAIASKTLRDKILLRIGPRPRFVAGGKPILADIDTVVVGRP